MKTILLKQSDLKRNWHLIDADGKVVGDVATKSAVLLRGKHKVTFSPHLDQGDGVIIINAEKVVFTGNKLDQKKYFRYSRYPGHVKSRTARELIKENPTRILEDAVAGMIPKNHLKKEILKRLKVYAGPDHPHLAQAPLPVTL